MKYLSLILILIRIICQKVDNWTIYILFPEKLKWFLAATWCIKYVIGDEYCSWRMKCHNEFGNGSRNLLELGDSRINQAN